MFIRLFDFTDKEFILLFTLIIIISVLLLFFVITFAFFAYRDRKIQKEIEKESSTIRIYAVDIKNNHVVYFNKSDLNNKYHINLNDFYAKFHPSDINKLKDWIFSIYVPQRTAEEYLEIDVMLDKGRQSSFSLLKLVKYNAETGVIHLESHILKYIAPTNKSIKKSIRPNPRVVNRSTIANLFNKHKSVLGFTFNIRFFCTRKRALTNEKYEKFMIMTLKNEIYPYAANPKIVRQIMDNGESEITLFDFKLTTKEDAIRFASSIARSLRKCIGVNSYQKLVSFSIGIVENAQFYQQFDMLMTKAQEACITAQQLDQETYLYYKSASTMIPASKYTKEVENLMKPGNLRYLFRPIVDIKNKKVLGYFEYVKAYDSPFSSFEEMSKYASMVGKNRDLFGMVGKYVIPKFASECQDKSQRLFFQVSLTDLEHIIDVLPQVVMFKNVKTVLMFNEQEIDENSSDIDFLNTALKSLKNNKYELAMTLKDKNLLLDPSVYVNFDYFVVGASMIGELKKNAITRLSIHSLVEQLLKYNRPIVATDLEGWQSIELIVKSGITIVSSEAISASNDMLLPIEKKKMEKLIAFGENYN